MNYIMVSLLLLAAFSCNGMDYQTVDEVALKAEQEEALAEKLRIAESQAEVSDGEWDTLLTLASQTSVVLLTQWIKNNASRLSSEQIQAFFDALHQEEPSDRYEEELTEEASSDLTKSWDPDAKIAAGGGSGSGESGSNASKPDEEKPDESQVKKSPRSSPRPVVEGADGEQTPVGKRSIVKRRKINRGVRKKEKAAFERKLQLAAAQRSMLDDRQWSNILRQAQEFGFFDLLVTWVKENRTLLSLKQLRVLFDALVKEEDLYSAGIKLKKEDIFRLDKDEGSIEERSDEDDSNSESVEADKAYQGRKKKTPHWLFERKWNIVKAYFLLTLDVLLIYSQKVYDETTALLPYQMDEDLVEIMRLAIATYAPEVEIEICKILHEAVESGSEELQVELVACLSNIILEKLEDRQDRPEAERLEPAALECLRAIIAARGGDLKDDELLGAFVSVCGAKLEPDLFEDLLIKVRVLDIDKEHAYFRLNRERSCFTMLEDWAIAHYENLKKIENHVQRLTTSSYKQIIAEKDAADQRQIKVNKKKSAHVKKADMTATRAENRGKLRVPVVEGIQATGVDLGYILESASVKAKSREATKPKPPKRKQNRPLKGAKKAMQDAREEIDGMSQFSKRKKEMAHGQAQNSEHTKDGLPIWLARRTVVVEREIHPGVLPEDEVFDEQHQKFDAVALSAPKKSESRPPRKALPMAPRTPQRPKTATRDDSSHEAEPITAGSVNSCEEAAILDGSLESSGVSQRSSLVDEKNAHPINRKDARRRAVTLQKKPLAGAIKNPALNGSLSTIALPDLRNSGGQNIRNSGEQGMHDSEDQFKKKGNERNDSSDDSTEKLYNDHE